MSFGRRNYTCELGQEWGLDTPSEVEGITCRPRCANQLAQLWNRHHRQRQLHATPQSQRHRLAHRQRRIHHHLGKPSLHDPPLSLRHPRESQPGPPPVKRTLVATIDPAPLANGLSRRLLGRDSLPPGVGRIYLHRCIHAIPPSGPHDADSLRRIKGVVGRTHPTN